jgi:pimeloyl-ACP methyl ester carboxylesterase
MLARRTLIAPAAAITAVVALGLGLLPTGATAAPAPSVDAAFAPTLTYVTCPADVKPASTKCAELTVPLDWQTPDDGRTTTIALRVIPSAQGRGGFTFNPGGPGGSGIDFHEAVYSDLPAQVRARFDYVSWDPRGVGLSGPALVDCPAPAGVGLPVTGPVDWRAFWEATLAAQAEANAACLAANPDAAPYLGTWQVVRDLEAMRVALGYRQWNYWGMSYGTRIGHAYARTFPTSLRALIMDGSVMAGETAYRFGTTFPAGLEVTKQVYASVTGRSQAHKINTILDYLNDHADIEVDGVVLNRWSFALTLRSTLVGQNSYPDLRAYINNIYDFIVAQTPKQRVRALRAVERSAARLPRVNEPTTVLVLVNCADLKDRPTAEQLAAASIAVERQYGITAPFFMGNAASCAGLPADMSPAIPTGTGTIALANPPVFVLATGDAATPWIWGRGMANVFAGSRVISYDSTQHVTYLSTPSACVNNPVTQYLLTLQRPGADTSCRFIASRPPAG